MSFPYSLTERSSEWLSYSGVLRLNGLTSKRRITKRRIAIRQVDAAEGAVSRATRRVKI